MSIHVAIQIRRATRDDLPTVVPLAVALVKQHHDYDPLRFALFERLEEGYAWFLGRELDDADAVVLVATAEGTGESEPSRVLGYAYGRIEEKSYEQLLDRHGALHDLYVDDAARGRGVARALVTAMMETLRSMGAPRMVLGTAQKNANAQALFEKLGFRRTMVEMTIELPGSSASASVVR